jgi:hypothetical protein
MPNEVARVKVSWTGFTGAPGYTNLYFNDFTDGNITQAIVDGARTRTDGLLATLTTRLPAAAAVTVDPTVDIIDVPTGKITRFMSGPAFTTRTGQGTGNYSAATGGVINWYTAGVINGRRVRGRTFLVPFAGSALALNGTLDDTLRASMITAINSFLAPGPNQGLLGVYARPQKEHVNKKGDTIPAHNGAWFPVTSFTHPDKVAVLRSRRD